MLPHESSKARPYQLGLEVVDGPVKAEALLVYLRVGESPHDGG
jgi:hypothetical protein